MAVMIRGEQPPNTVMPAGNQDPTAQEGVNHQALCKTAPQSTNMQTLHCKLEGLEFMPDGGNWLLCVGVWISVIFFCNSHAVRTSADTSQGRTASQHMVLTKIVSQVEPADAHTSRVD